jgi:hypothetical protein
MISVDASPLTVVIERYSFLLAFSAFLFFPSSYAWIKLGFFLLLLFFVLFDALNKAQVANYFYVFVFFSLTTIGLFLTAWSVFGRDNLNGFVGIRILFLSVVFYFVFSLFLVGKRYRLAWLVSSFYSVSAFISLNIIIYIFCKIYGLMYPLASLDLDYRFGRASSGLFAYSTNNLPIFMFTIPFMIAHNFNRKRSKFVYKLILFLSVVAACLSLRNALILVIIISFVVVLIVRKRIWLLGLCSLILVLFIYWISFSHPQLLESYSNLKLENLISGEDPRYLQSLFWIEMINEAPIFGHGIGSVVPSGGDIYSPYGYELTYLMLAAQIGLMPTAIYASVFLGSIFLLFYRYNWKSKSDYLADDSSSFAVGLAASMFLIASATNGYLMTLGYLWTVFLPITYLWWFSIYGGKRSQKL